MGDETYLESFIEQIQTLPSELRRNLELMKDLDKSCSTLAGELRQTQDEYVSRSQAKILQLEVGETPDGQPGVKVLGNSNDIITPTTEELLSFIREKKTLRKIKSMEISAVQQAEEKVAIAEQTYSIIESTVKHLDRDIAKFETTLKSAGDFRVAGSAKPNDLAAIQVVPNSTDWILAKVISHDLESGMYRLSDEDVESKHKVFHLPESQVVVLSGNTEKLSRGDIVYAVYPDTTSFYQAAVVQPPKRVTGSGGSFVMVNFVDDADEQGITHDKAVMLKHVMRVPYGAVIQPM
mmetsp:Transcript_17286/g.19949  ORF Transcript_17286/g.19949 Transcript_17286/m.19949 type:complete len:293 (-) Transcript_17286:55-933(-)|eukprot:CAMPEP_0194144276 /NCGR_PEP_ID=MMETSP0152-20130528/13349_1 /TAXON_ID=1049557 /ORGANISM="Thalassiothrix antarctica, Strain L6-D1" /LENGTH=292 /DNA_ID=CAMNT_0038844051 /DNA_START=50 /DNA_END=928 /DNA_ORIENTATION=-